jgi:hypothetical protein
VLTSEGLGAMKFKNVVNKRIVIDCWGFHLSQMGVQEDNIAESEHSKVFCLMQGSKE